MANTTQVNKEMRKNLITTGHNQIIAKKMQGNRNKDLRRLRKTMKRQRNKSINGEKREKVKLKPAALRGKSGKFATDKEFEKSLANMTPKEQMEQKRLRDKKNQDLETSSLRYLKRKAQADSSQEHFIPTTFNGHRQIQSMKVVPYMPPEKLALDSDPFKPEKTDQGTPVDRYVTGKQKSDELRPYERNQPLPQHPLLNPKIVPGQIPVPPPLPRKPFL